MKDLLWHLCEQQILRFALDDRRASLCMTTELRSGMTTTY
jgi:hypothetical protein